MACGLLTSIRQTTATCHVQKRQTDSLFTLEDFVCFTSLQLTQVGQHPRIGCVQVLGRLKQLIWVFGGSQQFGCSISHSDLMVDLLLKFLILEATNSEMTINEHICWVICTDERLLLGETAASKYYFRNFHKNGLCLSGREVYARLTCAPRYFFHHGLSVCVSVCLSVCVSICLHVYMNIDKRCKHKHTML